MTLSTPLSSLKHEYFQAGTGYSAFNYLQKDVNSCISKMISNFFVSTHLGDYGANKLVADKPTRGIQLI